MELRSYWSIIWRRIWIIALVVGVVAIYSAYQYYHLRNIPGALKAYNSQTTLLVGLQADSHSSDQSYSDYVTTSESLADEFVNAPVLNSQEFATEVIQQIQANMDQIPQRYRQDLGDWTNKDAIAGSLSSTHSHSLVTVSVTWNTAGGAWAIANAVGQVNIGHYLDYEVRTISSTTGIPHPLVSTQVVSEPTEPSLVAGPSANKPTLLLVLILVALIIGIALAFLVEYLDDRIRSADEVGQLLQLPVYAEIPRPPSSSK